MPGGRRWAPGRRVVAPTPIALAPAAALLLFLCSSCARAAAITCEPFAAEADQAAFELYCWDIS